MGEIQHKTLKEHTLRPMCSSLIWSLSLNAQNLAIMQWKYVIDFSGDQNALIWLPLASGLCVGSLISCVKSE